MIFNDNELFVKLLWSNLQKSKFYWILFMAKIVKILAECQQKHNTLNQIFYIFAR